MINSIQIWTQGNTQTHRQLSVAELDLPSLYNFILLKS